MHIVAVVVNSETGEKVGLIDLQGPFHNSMTEPQIFFLHIHVML